MNRADRIRDKIARWHYHRGTIGAPNHTNLCCGVFMPDSHKRGGTALRDGWTVARSRLSRAKFWRV